MITISEVVRDIAASSPFLEEGLAYGVINVSEFARRIKPDIELRLGKDVQIGTITTALNRFSKIVNKNFQIKKLNLILHHLSDLTIRSNLLCLTYSNSVTINNKLLILMNSIQDKHNLFLTSTRGIYETTVFASDSLDEVIQEIFVGEFLKVKKVHLSSLTIMLPKDSINVPGVYYSILKKLAWEGINFTEVISSYTELTIFLESKDINRAFLALRKI